MLSIQTKNDCLRQAIETLAQLVISVGGFVHPSLVIREVAGDFSVSVKRKLPANSPLIAVPLHCLPLLEQFNWSYENGVIGHIPRVVAEVPQGIPDPTEMQICCMQAMVEIYNLSNKVAQHTAISPLTAFGAAPDFLDLLSRREPELEQIVRSNSDRSLVELFIYFESRVYKDPITGGRCLLPIIDFFDHHSFAEAFQAIPNTQGDDCLQLNYLSVDNGKQCMASYSLMDAFHSWAKYSFVDRSAFFVESVPMIIAMDGVYSLRILAQAVNVTQLDPSTWQANNSNAYFYAAQHRHDETTLEVAFLLVPPVKHIEAFNEVLGNYLVTIERHHGLLSGRLHNADIMQKVKHAIIDENVTFYKALRDSILPVSGEAGVPVKLFREMFGKQLGIMKKFAKYCI